jgi:hypothetical protein
MIEKKTHYLKSVFLFLIIILPLKWNVGMDNETLKKPREFLYHKLDSLEGFEVKARTAEITELDGSSVLKIDGMIVFSGQKFSDASIEVEILAQGSCYPGIAFRIELPLKAGHHKIAAELKVTEPFGWGLIVTLNGQNLHLQPPED